jgi:hypothetical protein
MKASALALAPDATITLPPALPAALAQAIDGAQPSARGHGAAERRAASLARWEARFWMAAVLFGVLVSIVLALLVAPIRALLND